MGVEIRAVMKMKCNMIIKKVIKIRVKRRSKIVLSVINMMIMKMKLYVDFR